MDSEGVIDQAALDSLLEVTGGDREFLAELIESYFADTTDLLATMRRSLAAGDAPELHRAAHSLKSNSASFGAERLATLSRELEGMGNAGALDGAGAVLELVEAEYPRVERALRAASTAGGTA